MQTDAFLANEHNGSVFSGEARNDDSGGPFKEILCAVCQGAYAEDLRGRIGFDWSMTVPAASREWGRSSRKTASPKTKNNNTLALAA
jgi:hypothetical protein